MRIPALPNNTTGAATTDRSALPLPSIPPNIAKTIPINNTTGMNRIAAHLAEFHISSVAELMNISFITTAHTRSIHSSFNPIFCLNQ